MSLDPKSRGPESHPQAVEFHRLSTESYEQLERMLPKIAVTDDTSPHRAGYLLGIQHVLGALRTGFVVTA